MDIPLLIVTLLIGFGAGLLVTEIIAYRANRARVARSKKKRDAQPLLGVVLPPEEDK